MLPCMTVLKGRHVIVTGGSQGIGAAVAKAAAVAGAQVSLIARGAAALRSSAESLGRGVAWQIGDVTDERSVNQAVRALETRFGRCDILVCCAGVVLPGRLAEVPLREFDEQWAANVRGSIAAIKAVLPRMLHSGGHIVLVSSTAGILGVPGYTGYAATKFAIRGLADSLRYEVEPLGVRVTVVYPPDTDTPGFAAENLRKPPETSAISGRIRPVTADEVAAATIRGIERNKSAVTIDNSTRIFLRFGGLLDPMVRWSFQRTIKRVLAGRKPVTME